MRVLVEQSVPGVEPGAALAWWTDFRPGPQDHSFVPGAHREVHPADERAIEIHDTVRWLGLVVFRERVIVQTRGNTVQLSGENTFARFEGRYRFEPTFEPTGTRVTLEATIDLKGPLAWIERLLRPLVLGVLRWDTGKHLEEMRAALAPDG